MPTSARPLNTREPPKAEQTELFKWLVARGVAKRAARRFMEATRCETLHDAALYLRFELAPLQLANSDSVQADMRRLLGCGPRVARRVIADLDVFRAALLKLSLRSRILGLHKQVANTHARCNLTPRIDAPLIARWTPGARASAGVPLWGLVFCNAIRRRPRARRADAPRNPSRNCESAVRTYAGQRGCADASRWHSRCEGCDDRHVRKLRRRTRGSVTHCSTRAAFPSRGAAACRRGQHGHK